MTSPQARVPQLGFSGDRACPWCHNAGNAYRLTVSPRRRGDETTRDERTGHVMKQSDGTSMKPPNAEDCGVAAYKEKSHRYRLGRVRKPHHRKQENFGEGGGLQNMIYPYQGKSEQGKSERGKETWRHRGKTGKKENKKNGLRCWEGGTHYRRLE